MPDAPPRRTTLYERIGGDEVVSSLVDDFYGRVLADPVLAPFFEKASMDHLRAMQREFFAAALDGPIRYSGTSLADVHAGRGIQTRHVGRFVEILLETLRSKGIDEEEALEVISRINTYVSDITGQVGVDG